MHIICTVYNSTLWGGISLHHWSDIDNATHSTQALSLDSVDAAEDEKKKDLTFLEVMLPVFVVSLTRTVQMGMLQMIHLNTQLTQSYKVIIRTDQNN